MVMTQDPAGYGSVADRSSLHIEDVFSLRFVVYPTALSGRLYVYSTRTAGASGSWQVEIGDGNGGANRVAATSPGVWTMETANDALTLNAWNDVVWVKNGTTSQALYVNGTSKTLVTNAPIANSANADAKTLSSTTYYRALAGKLQELQLYTGLLTPTEIGNLFLYNQLTAPVQHRAVLLLSGE